MPGTNVLRAIHGSEYNLRSNKSQKKPCSWISENLFSPRLKFSLHSEGEIRKTAISFVKETPGWFSLIISGGLSKVLLRFLPGCGKSFRFNKSLKIILTRWTCNNKSSVVIFSPFIGLFFNRKTSHADRVFNSFRKDYPINWSPNLILVSD